MSWRTLNEAEMDLLDKLAVRGLRKIGINWISLEEVKAKREKLMSIADKGATWMVRYDRQGCFTVCQTLTIYPDGTMKVSAGASRRSKQDKKNENAELGEILAFRRAALAQRVNIQGPNPAKETGGDK